MIWDCEKDRKEERESERAQNAGSNWPMTVSSNGQAVGRLRLAAWKSRRRNQLRQAIQSWLQAG